MFEKYYQNVGGIPKDKEKLLTEFSKFLDDPMTYGGFFVVRCVEADDMVNTMSLKDFVKTLEGNR